MDGWLWMVQTDNTTYLTFSCGVAKVINAHCCAHCTVKNLIFILSQYSYESVLGGYSQEPPSFTKPNFPNMLDQAFGYPGLSAWK